MDAGSINVVTGNQEFKKAASTLLSSHVQHDQKKREKQSREVSKAQLENHREARKGSKDVVLEKSNFKYEYCETAYNKPISVYATNSKAHRDQKRLGNVHGRNNIPSVSPARSQQILDEKDTPFERKWLREQERIEIKVKKERMHERKYGVRPPIDLDLPCFDLN